MNPNSFINNMPNADQDGINAGANVGNLNVLKNTDVGVMRQKKDKDKSTYTRTTKPDGTVVEKIKMNRDNSKKGIVDVETDGVNLDGVEAKAGIGEKSQQDAVAFVDSIWGSKTVASTQAQTRQMEAQAKLSPEEQAKVTEAKDSSKELADFRELRQQQLAIDAEKRIPEQGMTL